MCLSWHQTHQIADTSGDQLFVFRSERPNLSLGELFYFCTCNGQWWQWYICVLIFRCILTLEQKQKLMALSNSTSRLNIKQLALLFFRSSHWVNRQCTHTYTLIMKQQCLINWCALPFSCFMLMLQCLPPFFFTHLPCSWQRSQTSVMAPPSFPLSSFLVWKRHFSREMKRSLVFVLLSVFQKTKWAVSQEAYNWWRLLYWFMGSK